MTPTQRSLAKLRDEGYQVWITEHWNHFARKRQDLFNFADLLAVKEGETLAVQTTSGSNVSARVKKIAENEYVPMCRKAEWRIQVWGWRKGKNGWTCRIVDCS